MRRRAAPLVLLAALILALAGCGGSEESQPLPETVEGTLPADTTSTEGQTGGEGGAEGDAAAGEQIYAEQGCGSCHALEAAGSSGTVGPNLDDAQPSVELIIERVTNGASPMPAFKDTLSEQQIQDVAAFVFESTHS